MASKEPQKHNEQPITYNMEWSLVKGSAAFSHASQSRSGHFAPTRILGESDLDADDMMRVGEASSLRRHSETERVQLQRGRSLDEDKGGVREE